jgi:hypothetical protein
MNLKIYHDELMCFAPTEFPLKSIMFYNSSDKAFHLEYILNVKSEEKKSKFAEELEIMNSYVSTNECRRSQLMQSSPIKIETQVTEDCCDNCVEKIIADTPLTCYKNIDENGQLDISKDVIEILKLLIQWTENKRYNRNDDSFHETDLINFYIGAHLTPNCSLAPFKYFQRGSHKSFDYWKAILLILKDENYISEYNLYPMEKSYKFIHSLDKKFKVCPKKKFLIKFLEKIKVQKDLNIDRKRKIETADEE